MSDSQHPALTDLLATLDLERLGSASVHVEPTNRVDGEQFDLPETFAEDVTLFRGRSQKQPHNRVFGGQVLAQGVIASGRTVADLPGPTRHIHSLHAYFMRPGDDTEPITFSVERMRDGRSFSTRRVHAIQHGKPILSMSASFQTLDPGVDHQDPMPPAPSPDEVPSLAQIFGESEDPRARHLMDRAIDIRHVTGNLYAQAPDEAPSAQEVWMRAVDRLPDEPLIHAAVLAYASDYTLLEPVLRRHGRSWSQRGLRMASLDHAMWFYRPARADEWILYAARSPSAQGGRGLGAGQMYSADGTLVASVAQEGMVRFPDLGDQA